MCGIAGWINLERDISMETGIMAQMSETLKNRGPDQRGEWRSPHAMLVHRRLSVVDPAGGAQPMVREREGFRYVITYNGELYNTLELRVALAGKGYSFRSWSDTEVLLASYMEWGTQCVRRLNGIYAFAIWNERDESLFLARDRFGVKPLFYSVKGDSLIFGSELKTLLSHPLARPVVNAEGLAEVLYMSPARTPGCGVYEDINEVKPACSILYDRSGIHHECYWSLISEPHPDGLRETVEKVCFLVCDSIRRQLAADVPLCTFLSGGLDSSIISAVAASSLRERRTVLDTYSVDYVENEKHFNPSFFQPTSDAPWVDRMSGALQTRHRKVLLKAPDLAKTLNDALRARDLPGMADIDSSLYLFCREVKRGATVALSGECADEVFGGYPWFHKPEFMDADTFPWCRFFETRLRVFSDDVLDAIDPFEHINKRYRETIAQVPRLKGENALESRRREIFFLNNTWFMAALLERKDRMSMAHGLEVRVPFCDHRLVEYVWNIPWDMKMYDGREKGILRKSMEGILPGDILRRKKNPYPKTYDPSYAAAVKDLLREIINDGSSPLAPLLDRGRVTALFEDNGPIQPWFGQLMALPQLFAWLIQVDAWLREYRVEIRIA